MSVVIKTIKDYFNNYVYPKTKTKAVYDDSNNRLDTTLSTVVHFDNDSSSGTISDPVLKQSDIATTLGTSDTVPASQKLVNTVNTTLGSASSASAVSGADAFSKISTLNSQLTSLEWKPLSGFSPLTITDTDPHQISLANLPASATEIKVVTVYGNYFFDRATSVTYPISYNPTSLPDYVGYAALSASNGYTYLEWVYFSKGAAATCIIYGIYYR